jgi:stalled ribosome alternative rescue factor ArfA
MATKPVSPRPVNLAAKALADPRYRHKVVRAKKGKGAYNRKGSITEPYAYRRVA